MFRVIKKFLIYTAALALVLQSSLFLGLINPQKAHAQTPNEVLINEFVSRPLAGEHEYAELYNPTDSSIPLDGWFITDLDGAVKYSAFTGATIDADGYYVVDMGASTLNNDDDGMILYDNLNNTIDSTRYGNIPTRMMPAPNQGQSASRVCDGCERWAVNTSPTIGATNGDIALPDLSTGTKVMAGPNNLENYINSFSQNSVAVEVILPSSSQNSDTVTAVIANSVKPASGTYFSTATVNAIAGSGPISAEGLRANYSGFSEGTIKTGAYITREGISTEYFVGTNAIKDTVPPAQPTAASVKKGDHNENEANVINNFNNANVSVDVISPETITTTDTVEAKLTDKDNVSKEKSTNGTGTTSATVTGINTTDPLADGDITVSARVKDYAGNSSAWFTGTNATKDTANPTGTIVINSYATIANSYSTTLTLTSSDAAQMKISNLADLSDLTAWETFTTSKSWSLSSGTGQKTVYAQFKDAHGNISAIVSDGIFLDLTATNITTNVVNQGLNQPIFPMPNLETDITGLASTTLTTASYSSNPGTDLPSGITSFGQYFEMAVANSQAISWPIIIKIYYTANDLTAAGLKGEQQLLGIYYWDTASSSWKLYAQTGVNTNDITVNGITYDGYVWANADHLTPIVIGADSTPPSKPSGFTAKSGDGEVSLNWEPVADAQGYYLRYREGTSIDDKPYTTIYLVGSGSNTTKVTGLKNGTLYEFGVRAMDGVGNQSEWAVVVISPTAPAVTPAAITAVYKAAAKQSAEEVKQAKQPQETEITTIGPEEGTVKAEKTATDWTRFWITILILVIALGAGFGGYYGYQWWMEGGKQKVKSKPQPPQPKQPEKGGRW